MSWRILYLPGPWSVRYNKDLLCWVVCVCVCVFTVGISAHLCEFISKYCCLACVIPKLPVVITNLCLLCRQRWQSTYNGTANDKDILTDNPSSRLRHNTQRISKHTVFLYIYIDYIYIVFIYYYISQITFSKRSSKPVHNTEIWKCFKFTGMDRVVWFQLQM